MPDPLPNILSVPGDSAANLAGLCVEHPVKIILAGFFCGLAIEAVVYLTGEAYEALRAYRDLIKAS